MKEIVKKALKSLLISGYQLFSKIGFIASYSADLVADRRIPSTGDYFVKLPSDARQFNMALAMPGEIEEAIAMLGQYEPHMTSGICAFMQQSGIFVDVGANIGYHSLYVAATLPDATCLAFDPHPTIYQQLRRNIHFNRSLGNIHAYEMAVGDRNGDINFYLQTDTSYNRGLSSVHHNYDIGDEFVETKVKIAKLDSFLTEEQQRAVSVIKIDTQGSEDQVIFGALETIKKSKPIIFFEFVTDYTQSPKDMIMSILNALPDYDVWKIKNWEYKRRQTPPKDWFPSLQPFDPSEVVQAGFWSDLVCLPKTLD